MISEDTAHLSEASQELSQQGLVALAAARWVKMGIPVRILQNGREIKDPRTPLERKDPVATYFALRQHSKKLNLALVTGPETGILALDVYTLEPGTGMEALEALGFFRKCCQADTLIRHECKMGNISEGRFHTVLYYAGKDQFLESALDQIPGVWVRRSGERVILPPSELSILQDKKPILRSSYELEGTIAPNGIAYLPDDLLKIIRTAERQKMLQRSAFPTAGKVKAELYSTVLEGARDTTLTRRAGYLIGYKKLSKDDALLTLRNINQRCCVPPLDDPGVRKIVNSIYKRHHRHA